MRITHIRQVDVVTLDEAGTVHRGVDLVVEGDRIAHLGAAPQDLAADEIVDGRGRVVMPGMVTSHGHSPMTLLRGWAEGGFASVLEWLQRIWQAEGELTEEDVYWGAALAAAEMIRAGTIAFNDMYFHAGQTARVVRESGMKAALSWGFFDPGQGTGTASFEDTAAWLREMAAENHPRIQLFMAPHALYTVSEPLLDRAVETAHELGLGIHMHLAESPQEVEQVQTRHGVRSVPYADSRGLFEAPGGCVAAHTLWVDEQDVEILAAKGVHVAHCPITYTRHGGRFPSLKPALDAGVKVSFATDGPTSNADIDMFAVMRAAVLIHRHKEAEPELFSGDEALRRASQMGAAATGFPESGSLRIGGPADFILVNLDAPHLQPVHDLVTNLVHSAKGADVTDVMVDGRWLMRDRELRTLDEARILHEASRRAYALVARTPSG